jgi:hypothetical protein
VAEGTREDGGWASSGAQPGIAMFGERAGHVFGAARVFAGTEPGVGTDLPAVFEAGPIADLA